MCKMDIHIFTILWVMFSNACLQLFQHFIIANSGFYSTNCALLMKGPLAPIHKRPQTCTSWVGFQTVSFIGLLTALESVLALRSTLHFKWTQNG